MGVKFDKKLCMSQQDRESWMTGHCPQCGEQVATTIEEEHADDCHWRAMYCLNCGFKWREIYDLVEVEVYPYKEDANENPISTTEK